jgi:two-component system nitrogen regulation sensor histidine kinase NtrY
VVAVFEDVTDLQKVERMYAWREVAKRIAHEIKNPLTPIQLSVERLRRRYLDKIKDDGTFGSATQLILKEVESLRTMVNEFSSFARLPEISPRPEDLNSIVLDSVNLFRAAHEGILFDLNLASDLPMLELDRSSIKRVLINLFDNSVTAMQGRGRIQVWTKLESSSKSIQLGVSDEGCGIPPNAVPQLFEPYFSTKAGGTGLGLAIVQRILSDHTATVRVAPNIPKGTQFIIEFPVTLSIQETKRREVGALPV